MHRILGYVGVSVQSELLRLLPGMVAFLMIDHFTGLEDDEEDDGEDGPANGGDLFREHVDHRDTKQREADQEQAYRIFRASDTNIESHFPLALLRILEAQHQDAQRLHE